MLEKKFQKSSFRHATVGKFAQTVAVYAFVLLLQLILISIILALPVSQKKEARLGDSMSFYAQMSSAQFRGDEFTKATVEQLKAMAERDLEDFDKVNGLSSWTWEEVFSELVSRICSAQGIFGDDRRHEGGLEVGFDGYDFVVYPVCTSGKYCGSPLSSAKTLQEAVEKADIFEFWTTSGCFECKEVDFEGEYTIGEVRQSGTSEWNLAFWPSEVGPSAFELGTPPEEADDYELRVCWDDQPGVDPGWFVEVRKNGKYHDDSMKIWFGVEIDDFNKKQKSELEEALLRAYPGARVTYGNA